MAKYPITFKNPIIALRHAKKHNKTVTRFYQFEINENLNHFIRVYYYKVG